MSRAILVALALVGCGGTQAPPPPVQNVTTAPPVDAAPAQTAAEVAIAKMQEFTAQMCMCADKACADKVQEGMTSWAQQIASKPENERPAKLTGGEMQAMTAVAERYGECMMTAMTAGTAPPPSSP